MTNLVFSSLLAIRAVAPPLIFSYLHPFIAILIDEFFLDGCISPHHFFVDFIPENIKGKHKIAYDIFLDTWGFANGLLPVLYNQNKFYPVFQDYRALVLSTFIYRLIGNILVYKFRDYRYLLIFQNFYLPVYIAIAFCDYFDINKKYLTKIILILVILFVIRELYLVSINGKL